MWCVWRKECKRRVSWNSIFVYQPRYCCSIWQWCKYSAKIQQAQMCFWVKSQTSRRFKCNVPKQNFALGCPRISQKPVLREKGGLNQLPGLLLPEECVGLGRNHYLPPPCHQTAGRHFSPWVREQHLFFFAPREPGENILISGNILGYKLAPGPLSRMLENEEYIYFKFGAK